MNMNCLNVSERKKRKKVKKRIQVKTSWNRRIIAIYLISNLKVIKIDTFL